MTDRFREELELLRRTYPDVQNGDNWVLIPNYRLPPNRFNLATTPVLFAVPVGYPNTGPDNFFVDVNLRLQGNAMPPAFNTNSNSSTGPAPIPGNWGWFSWHPSAWRPAANPAVGDNLLTFLTGVGVCLRGEESA
jgi:hypothetical protein